MKFYSGNKPAVFYKANAVILQEINLTEEKKDTKETLLNAKLSFTIVFRVSGFL